MSPEDPETRKQLELETEALQEGLRKYREQQNNLDPADTRPGVHVLLRAVRVVADAIRIERGKFNDAGWSKLRGPLLSLDPDKLAVISLRSILNTVLSEGTKGAYPTPLGITSEIARWCVILRRYEMRAENPHQVGEFDPNYWVRTGADLTLGLKLAELAVRHAAIVEKTKTFQVLEWVETVIKGTGGQIKTPKFLRLTTQAKDWLNRHTLELDALAVPTYFPKYSSGYCLAD